ncbi:hypothetical protein ACIQPR_09675 [Streptomyces sp. NPDC091280]|uniref:hypothetical protein n=1 Tax=Streptomyces sp. NPDC091280 TaxID=3365984 RepID=UPI0038122B31
MSVGFRPTEADNEIIDAHRRPGEATSDVLRRALRALDRQQWETQAREDMERIAASGEDLSEEPDDWGYDDQGEIVDLRGSHSSSSPGRLDSSTSYATSRYHVGVVAEVKGSPVQREVKGPSRPPTSAPPAGSLMHTFAAAGKAASGPLTSINANLQKDISGYLENLYSGIYSVGRFNLQAMTLYPDLSCLAISTQDYADLYSAAVAAASASATPSHERRDVTSARRLARLHAAARRRASKR